MPDYIKEKRDPYASGLKRESEFPKVDASPYTVDAERLWRCIPESEYVEPQKPRYYLSYRFENGEEWNFQFWQVLLLLLLAEVLVLVGLLWLIDHMLRLIRLSKQLMFLNGRA